MSNSSALIVFIVLIVVIVIALVGVGVYFWYNNNNNTSSSSSSKVLSPEAKQTKMLKSLEKITSELSIFSKTLNTTNRKNIIEPFVTSTVEYLDKKIKELDGENSEDGKLLKKRYKTLKSQLEDIL